MGKFVIADTFDKLHIYYYCGNGNINSNPYKGWKLDKNSACLFDTKRKADKLIKYQRKRDHWLAPTIHIEEIE